MAPVARIWARARRLDPRAVDLIVALVLGVVIVVQEASAVDAGVIEVLAGAVSAATVAWRRRAPVAATIVAAVCIGLLAGSGGAPNPELVVLVLNSYMLGRRPGEGAWLSLGVLLVVVALPAVALVPGSSGVLDVVSTWVVFIVLPFAGARVIGSRTAVMEELQADAERLEHEQRERARRAIGEERVRIARELHDVIAHSVSVMVIRPDALTTPCRSRQGVRIAGRSAHRGWSTLAPGHD